jgi:hypothetical protein
MAEVILPRRTVPQPRPFIVPQGDCGACVAGGLLDVPVIDVYDGLAKQGRACLQRENMIDLLWRCEKEGALDRVVVDVPSWPVGERWQTFGAGARRQWQAWARYVRLALDAGYYGLAEVDMTGGGIEGDGPNHWVLVCGWRNTPNNTVLSEILAP